MTITADSLLLRPKLDCDGGYDVAMKGPSVVVEACCRCMFRVFQRYVSSVFSRLMLQVCLSGCCICFTYTLHVFYLDVAYGCNGFQMCFRCFFQVF